MTDYPKMGVVTVTSIIILTGEAMHCKFRVWYRGVPLHAW